jgi:hypothetical protein
MTSLMRGTETHDVQPSGGNAPISDLDPYSDGVLLDPWSTNAELQHAGPAVWLSKYKIFALRRYESVWKALPDPASFPSSLGVMSKRYSGAISQAPRRARASALQKGFVARLDDTL